MSSSQPFRITVDVNVRGAEQIKKTEEQIKRTGKTAEQITERTWSKFDRFAKWAFMRIMGLLGVMFVWERMWRTIAEESVDVGVLMDEWSIIVSDALMPLGETIANILDTLTPFLEVMRDLVEREDALGMATRYLLAVGFTFFFLLERLAMPILSLGITVGYLASGIGTLTAKMKSFLSSSGKAVETTKQLAKNLAENKKGSFALVRGLIPVNNNMIETNTQFTVFNKLGRKINRGVKGMTRGIKKLGKKAMIAGGAIASLGMMFLFSGEMGEQVSETFDIIGDILGDYFAPVFEFIQDILYDIEDSLGESTGLWALLGDILGMVAGIGITLAGALLTLSGQPYIGVPLLLAGGFVDLRNVLTLTKQGLIELGKPFPELQALGQFTLATLNSSLQQLGITGTITSDSLRASFFKLDKKMDQSGVKIITIEDLFKGIPKNVEEPWEGMLKTWGDILKKMEDKTRVAVLNILRELAKIRGGGVVTTIEAQRAVYLGYRSYEEMVKVPKVQRGGFVERGGLAYLHPAEIVVPYREPVPSTGEIVINNIFNVEATVREEADIYRIAEELSRLQREGV